MRLTQGDTRASKLMSEYTCVEEGLSRSFSGGGGKPSFPSTSAGHDTGCLGLVHWEDPEGWNGEGGGRRVQDGEHTACPTLTHLDRALSRQRPAPWHVPPPPWNRVGDRVSFVAASRGAQGVSGPSSSCVWNPRVFADTNLGSGLGRALLKCSTVSGSDGSLQGDSEFYTRCSY